MAKVRQRTWTVPGQRTKRKAWGFVTVGEDGKQIRVFRSDWSKEDAEKALAKRTLEIEQPKPKAAVITFAQAVGRHLTAKARKRTIDEDRRILGHLQQYFGEGTHWPRSRPAGSASTRGIALRVFRAPQSIGGWHCYDISCGSRTTSGNSSRWCRGSEWRRNPRAVSGG
jgi:hypothetical protein